MKLTDKQVNQSTSAADPSLADKQKTEEAEETQLLAFPPMPKVVFGDSPDICDQWCAALPREKKLLGFSAEKYRKGDLYMIQLASRDSILLVPCSPHPIPASVRAVLRDIDSIKTGIDVAKDVDALIRAGALHSDFKFKPLTKKTELSFDAIQNGFLDIGSYCQMKLGSGASDAASYHDLKSVCRVLKFELASENILPPPPSPRGSNSEASSLPRSPSPPPMISDDQRQSFATHAWCARWLALEAIQQAKNNSTSLSPRTSGL